MAAQTVGSISVQTGSGVAVFAVVAQDATAAFAKIVDAGSASVSVSALGVTAKISPTALVALADMEALEAFAEFPAVRASMDALYRAVASMGGVSRSAATMGHNERAVPAMTGGG